jgi:penicillin-binding protein 2
VWNAGETVSVAIGQSFVLTSILQLANMYAGIANGGTLYKPFIVKQIESTDGHSMKEFQPDVLSKFKISPRTLDLVKQGLWNVVNTPHGTAYSQRLSGMDVAGKTGTIQLFRIAADKIYQRCENMRFKDRHNGMFVAFAPLNNPSIAVAVVTEHSCHGATGSGPIAKAVIKKYLEKYYPDQYGEKVLATHHKEVFKSMPTLVPTQEEEPAND